MTEPLTHLQHTRASARSHPHRAHQGLPPPKPLHLQGSLPFQTAQTLEEEDWQVHKALHFVRHHTFVSEIRHRKPHSPAVKFQPTSMCGSYYGRIVITLTTLLTCAMRHNCFSTCRILLFERISMLTKLDEQYSVCRPPGC